MDDDSDFRPEPQPPNEVRQRLTEHLESAQPCSIVYEHDEEVCETECFVASVHSDFVILGRITQACHLDGWRALRLPSVIRVDNTEDAPFTLRAMKANAVSLPIKSPINCDTFHAFLNKVCDSFNIITTDDDPTLIHPSAAGTIVKVDSQWLTIRAMSTSGYWEREPHKIELKHLTHVVFGGGYERTLERIAQLPDSEPGAHHAAEHKMAKRKSNREVLPVKDEDEQQPIPTAWRPAFRDIINAFVQHDYRLAEGVDGVLPVSAKTAKQIREYIEDYGETLVALPDKTWTSSVFMWMGKKWEVLIDLWTKGEGRSDLVLSALVSETQDGFQIKIEMVYVP